MTERYSSYIWNSSKEPWTVRQCPDYGGHVNTDTADGGKDDLHITS